MSYYDKVLCRPIRFIDSASARACRHRFASALKILQPCVIPDDSSNGISNAVLLLIRVLVRGLLIELIDILRAICGRGVITFDICCLYDI